MYYKKVIYYSVNIFDVIKLSIILISSLKISLYKYRITNRSLIEPIKILLLEILIIAIYLNNKKLAFIYMIFNIPIFVGVCLSAFDFKKNKDKKSPI